MRPPTYYFQFEFGLYKQKYVVPVGGPLSCLISDILMEDYERKLNTKLLMGQSSRLTGSDFVMV